jgi:hypothetical protein
VKDLEVDAAWLDGYTARRNIDFVELRSDGRTDSDHMGGKSVKEADAMQDARREPPVKREERRHAENAYRASRESLKIVAVKVGEVNLSPVTHDTSARSGQEEARDERAWKPPHHFSRVEYARRLETPRELATHAVEQPHTMALPRLPPAELANVHLFSAW